MIAPRLERVVVAVVGVAVVSFTLPHEHHPVVFVTLRSDDPHDHATGSQPINNFVPDHQVMTPIDLKGLLHPRSLIPVLVVREHMPTDQFEKAHGDFVGRHPPPFVQVYDHLFTSPRSKIPLKVRVGVVSAYPLSSAKDLAKLLLTFLDHGLTMQRESETK
jgi:hypothetical protein